MDVEEAKGPPLHFRHYETVKNSHVLFFLENFIIFSKFFDVSAGSLLHFFDILQQTGFSKSPKSPPFYTFKNFALFEPWIWRRLYTFPSCLYFHLLCLIVQNVLFELQKDKIKSYSEFDFPFNCKASEQPVCYKMTKFYLEPNLPWNEWQRLRLV